MARNFRPSVAYGLPLAVLVGALTLGEHRSLSREYAAPAQPARQNTDCRNYSASRDAVDFIKGFEQFRARAYKDQGGKLTIGYGHLIKPGEKIRKITRQKGETILKRDLAFAEKTVKNSVRTKLTQGQYDALVSLVYNIGPAAFRGSELLKELNSGDYQGAAEQFRAWRFVGGKESKGLAERRAKEKQMFRTGIYSPNN